MKGFLKRYWPSMIVVAVIAYATLYPDPLPENELPLIPHIDKLIHAIMFGGMAGALAFDYARSGEALTRLVMLAFCLIATSYGIVTETLQDAMELGRSGDGYDLIADCTGIAVAFFTAPPAIRAVLKRSRK